MEPLEGVEHLVRIKTTLLLRDAEANAFLVKHRAYLGKLTRITIWVRWLQGSRICVTDLGSPQPLPTRYRRWFARVHTKDLCWINIARLAKQRALLGLQVCAQADIEFVIHEMVRSQEVSKTLKPARVFTSKSFSKSTKKSSG